MRKLIITTFFIGLSPFFVFAHGTNYLEFNPDYFKTKSLNVSSSGVIGEIFLPVNEFLGGADFWFDNAGNIGEATFGLYNQNNILLKTKNVAIPHINPIMGGQRIHVDFTPQVAVTGSNKYKIKISSTLPQLQIYYSDRVKILSHNQPYLSEYVNGAAEIGGEEKEFSFKYALYETIESAVPIISNLSWDVASPEQMRVDFNVNEPVDYRIEYSPSGQGLSQSTSFSNEYRFCTEGVVVCSITLSVYPGTAYQYTLTIKDSWGSQAQTTGTFISGQALIASPTPTPGQSPTNSPTIPPLQDEVPPTISNLRIAEITSDSVAVAWTTSEAANSHLLISTPFLISVIDDSDPTMEFEHLLRISNVLSRRTNYIATVTSIDMGSNSSRASISFGTLSSDPTPAPTPISTVTPNQTNQPTATPPIQQGIKISYVSSQNEFIVTWDAPVAGEPTDGYRIDIINKEGSLEKSILAPKGNHSVSTSVMEKGDYSVIIYANNDGVFEKVDKQAELAINDPPFIKRLLGFWWALIPLLAGLGYIFLRNRNKAKPSQPTPGMVS